MMATEPSGDDLGALSVPSQLPLIDQANDLHHHDVSTENDLPVTTSDESPDKPIVSFEEQSNSADGSLSGGSDTEASRTDWSRLRDVDKGHGRSASSAKKPTTFKAVSVNKTFLASKANPSGGAPKPIEKSVPGSSTPPPGMSSLSSTRPRLIAKTGGGARDSAPKFSSASNGAKPSSAPDPSAVWNKNRPPEPKKFTDEELKKYGIHMASRLNEDDAQGQNKWADIDDDDEDWAPEAITWGDGTKTTLPHLDDPAVPTQNNVPLSSVGNPYPKPKSPVPLSTTKLQAAKSSGLASGRGLVLKPASQEKPSLISKPNTPAIPVKSPWATLPPVDRASPGLADSAANGQAQSREGTQTKPLHQQTKEMTADDFTRSSWRDSSSHGNRELYNSQSGRYEPVPDRRGSFKFDVQSKQPALLQRPQPTNQTMDAHGPQQASRDAQDGPYTGRRRSSSVSTGNGSFHRRGLKSTDPTIPPADRPNVKRPSFSNTGETPVSPGEGSISKYASLKDHLPSPRITDTPTVAESATIHSWGDTAEDRVLPSLESKDELVNEVEYQKKLMRERIELARKRRQYEEAEEEAAKKERIQKKLEALGPPPEKRGDKKEAPPMTEVPKPTQIQQRERPPFSGSYTDTVERPSARGQTSAHAGTPSQPVSPQAQSQLQSPNISLPSASTSFRRLSQGQESRRNDPWGGPGPRSERFPSWASAAPPASRNVWGSPDNDRGLGNGTFNPDLGRVTNASTAPSKPAKGPSPIAPPRNGTGTPSHSQEQTNPGTQVDSRSSRYVPIGSELASKWVASVAENDQKLSAARLTERANRERQLMERGVALEDSQPVIKDSWRPIRVPGDGTRHPIGSVDVQSHQTAPWKPAQDSLPKGAIVQEDSGPSAKAGIIGCGAPSQFRPSRFFPTRDSRQETSAGTNLSRSTSPTPPPPTMEDHPVYEGDVLRPHVSLPKPQPVVKLPPTMVSTNRNTTRPHGPWLAQVAVKDSQRGDSAHTLNPGGENIWQARFHKLLHGDKPPPARDIGVDASSRGFLDPVGAHTSAVVLLPNSTLTQTDGSFRSLVTKPMAEECFEEQEMGSLPQIRLPHKAPEAAWQPAIVQSKGLPKRLLVQAAVMEPFQISSVNSAGPLSINVFLLGMRETRTVLLPNSLSRGSRVSHGQRSATKHRTFGTGPRGGKKEAFKSQDRTGFRSRNSDNWTRHQSSQSRTPSRPQS